MAQGFTTITVTPSANVATNGTLVFTYASGNASQFAQSGEILVVSGLNNVLHQAADTFTLSYGSTAVTATYKDATTIPAGTPVTIQLPLAVYAQITDNTGGTVTDAVADVGSSFSQSALNNIIASLTAKINTLIALSKARDNIPRDDRN